MSREAMRERGAVFRQPAPGGDSVPAASRDGVRKALLGNECLPNRCSCPSVRAVNRWNLLSVQLLGDLMQAAIPAMWAVGAGSIINVASIFGVTGSEGYVAYTASKAAIIAMTKTAALEHAADGIRVNAICPGGVSTPMNENEPEGGVVPLTPLGRRAHVNEISGAIAYLASDDASFVTGTELVIDGGYLAR